MVGREAFRPSCSLSVEWSSARWQALGVVVAIGLCADEHRGLAITAQKRAMKKSSTCLLRLFARLGPKGDSVLDRVGRAS
jgi:hypothetical protein